MIAFSITDLNPNPNPDPPQRRIARWPIQVLHPPELSIAPSFRQLLVECL